ncbi:MAG: CvpA family protein [Chitinophagaceae bacterium]|nr:CvpA family protein [Chitinophagaceae bacterium]
MIDIIFAILLIIAIVKGMRKGLVLALFSIIAFIIGLAAAMKLSAVVAEYLQRNVAVPGKWLPFISFAMVFLVVVVLVNWAGKFIEKSFEMAFLGWANKLTGAALYVVLYIIIFSVFLFYAEKIHLLQPETFQQSATYPYIRPWGPVVIDNFGKIIPVFKDSFASLTSFFAGISDKIQH